MLATVGEMLTGIMDYFVAYCGESAHLIRGELIEMGNIAFVHSADTVSGTDLQVGIEQDGFYVQSWIAHPENMRLMDDDFWREWLKLADLGDVSFAANEELDDKQQKQCGALFNESGSNFLCSCVTKSPMKC